MVVVENQMMMTKPKMKMDFEGRCWSSGGRLIRIVAWNCARKVTVVPCGMTTSMIPLSCQHWQQEFDGLRKATLMVRDPFVSIQKGVARLECVGLRRRPYPTEPMPSAEQAYEAT